MTLLQALTYLDELMEYRFAKDGRTYPADASGNTFRGLHEAGVLPDPLVDVLVDVATTLRSGGRLSDHPLLFEGWLFAFEIHASTDPRGLIDRAPTLVS